MKIKFMFASCLIPLASGILCAQVEFSSRHSNMVYSTKTIEPKVVQIIDGVATYHYSLSGSNVNGSPYLNEEFVEGALTAADGTRIEGLKFRYNIYADEMQFILKKDTASVNRPLALRSVELGDKKFIYEVYQVSENLVAAGYFEVISEGNLSLLYRRELELDYDVYVPNYGGGGGTKDVKLKKNNNLYTKLGKSTARRIYNKRDFLNAITGHHDEAKAYIKKNRINVRKQKDLEDLVSYYNTL